MDHQVQTLTLPSPSLNYMPKPFYRPFKYFQGWLLNHFPGCPVLMLDSTLGGARPHHSLCNAHFFCCPSFFCSELCLWRLRLLFSPTCSVMSDSLIQDFIAARLVLPNRITVPLKKNMNIAHLRFPIPQVSCFFSDIVFIYLSVQLPPSLVSLDAASALSTWIVGFQ